MATDPTRSSWLRRMWGLVWAAALVGLAPAAAPTAPRDEHAPPRRMVWAWERPTDLRGLEGSDVGVAFYASTLRVRERDAYVVPRRATLRLPATTYRMAVLRVEPDEGVTITASGRVVDALVAETHRLLALPGVRAIQLDFDARARERPAHAAFVRAVRDALPSGTFFSITTLASHCFGDPLVGASVALPDEIVPMYFRMGGDDAVIRDALRRRGRPEVEACARSAGIALDESRPALDPPARLYVFLTGPADVTTILGAFASAAVPGAPR